LMFIKNLNSKIELAIETDFKSTVFSQSLSPNSFTSISYIESQQIISLPVSATYTLGKGKYTPYARLGINTGLLISSGADIITDPGSESPRISNLNNRQLIGFYGVLGGGVKFKISKAYLFLDVRYNVALANQVNNSGRNDTTADELWLYQTRDDNFYHDDVNFSLGFVRTLYQPRKK